jgi:tellurite resistance protein
MIILALALAASSPAENALQAQLAPCRRAAIASLQGDPEYLSRWLRSIKASRELEAKTRARCMVYFQGALDGLEIRAAQDAR